MLIVSFVPLSLNERATKQRALVFRTSGMRSTNPGIEFHVFVKCGVLETISNSEVRVTGVFPEFAFVLVTNSIPYFVADVIRHLLNLLSVVMEVSCSALFVE